MRRMRRRYGTEVRRCPHGAEVPQSAAAWQASGRQADNTGTEAAAIVHVYLPRLPVLDDFS